jgi:asparagine synthase (glutamine-hydrolysing)
MCGICGVVGAAKEYRVDRESLVRMRDTLIHRGPDDCGIYLGAGIGLGHRRLSIIDLRAEGRQPLSNEDDSLHIVFNGEIYNYLELRRELLDAGHRFRSETDTEVVVHLYEQYGAGCLKRLRGMFAFAIWDERDRSLFLARDRIGKKPLYYSLDDDRIAFASEAKALLAAGIAPEPDLTSINQYLTYGYVPGARSGFRAIRKLPPAHYLFYRDGRAELNRYWRLGYVPKLDLDEREARAELLRRMREAVALRMVADVGVGAFLSGGIDSSAVVAMMSELSAKPVKTFSIGFRQSDYDETRWARMVAERFHTEHHELIVESGAGAQLLDTLAWHYDEPYADSSAIATWYLAKMTREHVTVALNGDGGDENFAGYRRHSVTALAGRLDAVPRAMRRAFAAAFAHGYRLTGGNRRLAGRLRILGEVMEEDWRAGYARMISWLSDDEKAALRTREFAGSVADHRAEDVLFDTYADIDADDPLDQTLGVDVSLYLPEDGLVKVDRASMAASLEARSPLLDHELMEFVARLPARFKLHRLERKWIFKRALRGILPDSILHRRKMGFGVPLDAWFRTPPWIELLHDVLLSRHSIERGYFVRDGVARLIEEHVAGIRDRHHQLWMLLMLEMWHRTFVDVPSPRRARDSVEAGVKWSGDLTGI